MNTKQCNEICNYLYNHRSNYEKLEGNAIEKLDNLNFWVENYMKENENVSKDDMDLCFKTMLSFSYQFYTDEKIEKEYFYNGKDKIECYVKGSKKIV
jgi:hypothetical protein